MYFFDHKYPKAENTDLKSHSNEEKAKPAVAYCDYCHQQLLIVTIASNKVITPQDYCVDHTHWSVIETIAIS